MDILYPNLQPFHNRTWFRNIALDEPVTVIPAICSNISNTRAARADGCPLYYTSQSSADFSVDWNVTYAANHKVVWNVRVGQQYVLYERGTVPPLSTYPTARFFEIPLQSIAVTETVTATFLEILGLRENIDYMSLTYVTSGCLRVLGSQGKIKSFNSTLHEPLVDAVFSSQFSSASRTNAKYVTYSSTSDPGTLHRAEWIEFIALFFNKESAAQSAFSKTVSRYNCQRNVATTLFPRPVVAWVTYSSFSQRFTIYSTTAYKRQFTEDAGGSFLTTSTTSFTSSENFLSALQNVDVLIDESFYPDLSVASLSTFCNMYRIQVCNTSSSFKFLRGQNVWRFDGLASAISGGGIDWFESAIPEPDVVIEDLIDIFHPGKVQEHNRTWFRNIATAEPVVIEPVECANVSTPLASRAEGACPVYVSPVDHSEDWNATIFENFKVVWNRRVSQQYVLYRRGTQAPRNRYPTARFFEIPLRSLAISETVAATYLEILGLSDRITFMDLTYVTSGCLRVLGNNGNITSFESSFGGNATRRAQQIVQVDAVLSSQFDSEASSNPKFVTYSATSDPGPLHRAEWIEFIALFFDVEFEAANLFSATVDRYTCHRVEASKVAASIGRPVVAWISYSSFSSKPYQISTATYKRILTTDAGGEFFAPTTTGYLTAPEFTLALDTVDIVIDESYNFDVSSVTKQTFCQKYGFNPCDSNSRLKFIARNQVWRVDGLVSALSGGGLDWFESSIPEPDVVLEDLIQIVQPIVNPTHTRTWLRNIAAGEQPTVEPITCSNLTIPRPTRADTCTALGTTLTPTPAPTMSPEEAVVPFSLTFTQVDSLLTSSSTEALNAFIDFVKADMASYAQVDISRVKILTISIGSIVLEGTITFPPNSRPERIRMEQALATNPEAIFSPLFEATYGVPVSSGTPVPTDTCANTIMASCGDDDRCQEFDVKCDYFLDEKADSQWCEGKCYATNDKDCCQRDQDKAVGFGVGLGIGILLLVTILVYLWMRRRKKHLASVQSSVVELKNSVAYTGNSVDENVL
ncbi:hypothetical protein AAMO2058_001461100 [Amorphochlora amoebiformis]